MKRLIQVEIETSDSGTHCDGCNCLVNHDPSGEPLRRDEMYCYAFDVIVRDDFTRESVRDPKCIAAEHAAKRGEE